MSNVANFFKTLGLDLDSLKQKGKDMPIDPETLRLLKEKFEELETTMDVQSSKLTSYRKKLILAQESLADAADSTEVAKITKQINDLTSKIASGRQRLEETEKNAKQFLELNSQIDKLDPSKLRDSLKSFNSFDDTLKGNSKSLGKIGNLSKGFFENFSKSAGAAFTDMSGFLMKGLTNPLSAFLLVGELAAAQILELNDRLIDFGREMGNVINYSTLGYDATGNSTVGGNSLAQNAGQNGLGVEDILKTYSAFKQGSGTIGSANLEANPKELQKYGIEVGKLNKLYGISSESTSKVAKVLTQQYGKGIKETADIMDDGAKAAKAAGLNVGIFFENLSAIADLKGTLFVRGGTKGLEEAATSLSKLGLGAEKLSKLQDSYTGFSDLIDRQQKAVAMGMTNIAAAQNKIFAKLQLGDTAGALRIRQAAGAKDIQGNIVNGQINQQGIQKLQSQGYDKEEIASIERIAKSAKELGVSIDQVVTGNNLTEQQRKKLANIQEQELSIKEKLFQMWSSIKSVIVDPLTSILGPVLRLTINVITTSFNILAAVLKPVTLGLEKLGNLFGSISGDGAIVKILGSILAVLIGWKLWAMTQAAASGIKDGIGSLVDMFGKGGGGKLGKVGEFLSKSKIGSKAVGLLESGAGFLGKGAKSLLGTGGKLLTKGVGVGALASLGGEAVGSLISGDAKEGSTRKKVGDTVGTAASWAGTGAVIGSFIPILGTAIGAGIGGLAGIIKENWGGIKEGLGGLAKSTEGIFASIFPMAGAIIPFVKDFWTKDKDKDMTVKIASLSAHGGGLPEISRIMEGKRYNTTINQQSEIENMKNSNAVKEKPAPIQVNITNDSHMMGSLKSRIAGR